MEPDFGQGIVGFYQWAVDYWFISGPIAGLVVLVFLLWPTGEDERPGLLFKAVWHGILNRLHPQHGKAKWASRGALSRAGLFKPGGLFLGCAHEIDLFLHGEECIFTLAPRGAGKTTGLVVPTLLNWRGGSFVVTDPSGEITAMTGGYREKVSTVVVLNPWQKEMQAEKGFDFGSARFNPLSAIEDNAETDTEARLIASILLPQNPNAANPYWIETAQELLTALIGGMVRIGEKDERTLTYLFRLVRDANVLVEFLEDMAACPDETLQSYAAQFLDLKATAAPQWQGVLGEAQRGTRIYAPGTALGDHVAASDFNIGDLKERDMTVYIVIPSRRIHSHKAWLNLMVTLIVETIGKPGPVRPVVMMCDEFQNLGHLPTIQSAMAQYRKAGLRVWLISQTMGRLAEIYGPHGLDDLLGQSDVKQFFAVNDPKLAEDISKWLGEKTVSSITMGAKGEESFAQTGMRLIFADELMQMKQGGQIIVKAGLPPIKGRLVPYFDRTEWKRKVGANPYRRH